ncbi:MAG TPA: type IV secretion protein Rhs, partial [Pseudonocardiaceae bacterium]
MASADLVVNGWGDAAGYHVEVGREAGGFAWHEVALLRPAGFDDGSWTGYQCVSGDGRYAAVAILPGSAVNIAAARDHGGFAYSVDLASGTVRPVAAGVGLKYYSPGCGVGDDAVFTSVTGSVDSGGNAEATRLLTANLATGAVTGSVTVPTQVTSAVPTAAGPVGVEGADLVAITTAGTTTVARVAGTNYDLRPAADGGVTFLNVHNGSTTALVEHEHAGSVLTLGSGAVDRMQLFGGRAGRAVLSGAAATTASLLSAAGVTAVNDAGLGHAATAASLDGDVLVGPNPNAQQIAPQLLATKANHLFIRGNAPATAAPATGLPAFRINVAPAAPLNIGAPQPKADAAPTAAQRAAAKPAATQTPTCAVPRLDPTKQVMQPNPAQVDWA